MILALLCSGCALIPVQMVGRDDAVRRVYCSANSVGFDFHFDAETGEVFSYNKASNALVAFDIRKEVPFSTFVPRDGYDQFVNGLSEVSFETSIVDNSFTFSMYPADLSINQHVKLSLNLDTLLIDLDANVPDAPFPLEIIEPVVNDQITCEYIQSEVKSE